MRYLHTMVRVSNLDAALHFYRDLLGMKEVERTEHAQGRFTLAFLCAPGDEKRARENWAPGSQKWERDRDNVRYCSERCRKGGDAIAETR